MSAVKSLMRTCSGAKGLTGQWVRPNSTFRVRSPFFELGAAWALRGGERRGIAAGEVALSLSS